MHTGSPQTTAQMATAIPNHLGMLALEQARHQRGRMRSALQEQSQSLWISDRGLAGEVGAHIGGGTARHQAAAVQ